jgi:hypothetical protein
MTTTEALPIACTLNPGEFKDRLAWIGVLTRDALRSHERRDLVLHLRYGRRLPNAFAKWSATNRLAARSLPSICMKHRMKSGSPSRPLNPRARRLACCSSSSLQVRPRRRPARVCHHRHQMRHP